MSLQLLNVSVLGKMLTYRCVREVNGYLCWLSYFLFTMLLMKCDDKVTYYNASLAPGPHMHADYITRMA